MDVRRRRLKQGKKAILCCAKRKYKTATTTETKPNRWNLSGGRIYLKSWSTTLVTWWVREMNKRNSNTNPACQSWWWREEKREEKKNTRHNTHGVHAQRTANLISHEMITNDREWNGWENESIGLCNGHIWQEIKYLSGDWMRKAQRRERIKRSQKYTNPIFTLRSIKRTRKKNVSEEVGIHEFSVMCACKFLLPSSNSFIISSTGPLAHLNCHIWKERKKDHPLTMTKDPILNGSSFLFICSLSLSLLVCTKRFTCCFRWYGVLFSFANSTTEYIW